jgi:hypothetical protein
VSSIDTRALLLIAAKPVSQQGEAQVTMAGPPLALLEVAGKSPLQRTVENLEQAGVAHIAAVIEAGRFSPSLNGTVPHQLNCRSVAADLFWRTGEGVFDQLVQGGADLVLIIRLGAYAEVDFAQMQQFHLEQSARVTRVGHAQAPEIFCVSGSRRNDAASLFRSELSRCRSESMEFPWTGYVNPLADARDLRQFAVDILTLRTVTKPVGQQSRPGVWIDAGAVMENGSRIVAPAFVGSSARIRAGALVTRCTAIEHHAEVDCGTVVENSTVLPHSYVGAGLDLAHCVAGMGQIVNLRRNATVTVADPTLLGKAAGSGDWLERAVTRLFSLLPQSLRGRLDRRTGTLQPNQEPVLIPKAPTWGESVAPGTLQENSAAGEYSSSLVVARRYGDR